MQVQNALYPGLGGSFHGGGLDVAAFDPDDIRNFIDDEAGQFTLEIHNRDAAQAVFVILGEPEAAAQRYDWNDGAAQVDDTFYIRGGIGGLGDIGHAADLPDPHDVDAVLFTM